MQTTTSAPSVTATATATNVAGGLQATTPLAEERVIRPTDPFARGRYEAPAWAFVAVIVAVGFGLLCYAAVRSRRDRAVKKLQAARITDPKSYQEASAR